MNAPRRNPGISWRLTVWLTTLVCWCGISIAANAQGALFEEAATEFEVVYLERVWVDEDGAVLEIESEGSADVLLRDGTIHRIDYDELTDPDGNKYQVIGDSYQESEFDPVVHELRLVKYQPDLMTEEEVIDTFLDVYPDATQEDIDELVSARARSAEAPDIARVINPEVYEWVEAADPDDVLRITLTMHEQPLLELPHVPNHLLEEEPAAWLEGMENRRLAIEDRKTELYALQDEIEAELAPFGFTVEINYWLLNGVVAEASPSALEAITQDERFVHVGIHSDPDTATYYHAGENIREATQINQFLDAGLNGQHGSGESEHDEIYALIVDTYIDMDHPAWRDGAPPSHNNRLISSEWWWPGGSQWIPGSRQALHPNDQHGNRTASAMLADLTEGQDPLVTDPTERLEYSGMTTKTVFSFLEKLDGPGYTGFMQRAMDLNVDIVNLSIGSSGNHCSAEQNYHQDLKAINGAMLDGIFVVECAGNSGHQDTNGDGVLDEQDCTVWNPGGASGSFVVAAYDSDATANLNDAPIWEKNGDPTTGSSRGYDDYTRPIIKIAAPGGRELVNQTPAWPYYNDTYAHKGGSSTSKATPVAAGAAADLKDHLLSSLPNPHGDQVGLLFAHMLLMGDGKIESGTQVAQTPIDPVWGVGRLRMRMFNSAGMDWPWRRRWAYWTHEHGELFKVALNPDINDVNQEVPEDAEWFRAALWFHEPNMSEPPLIDTSSVALRVCDTGGCYSCSSTVPQSQRLWLGTALGGETWEVRVAGLNIPAAESGPFEDQQKRKMFLAFYWEDRDRDDTDGPPSNVL